MKQVEHAQPHEIAGMDGDGWSNSPAAAHAPDDVIPDVAAPAPLEPGWSNRKAVGSVSTVSESASPVTTPLKRTAKRAARK